MVKIGVYRDIRYFFILLIKDRFWYSLESPRRATTIYVLRRNMKNIRLFYLKIFPFFLVVKFSIYLNRHVFVMCVLSLVLI